MKKKVLASVLAAVMIAGLTACGGQAAAPAPAPEAPAAEAPAKEEAEAPAEEAPAEEAPAAEEAGGLISVGFAQVGHESDWRTASTKSCQDVFSEANGYNLSFVDCDNDSAAQLEAVRSFIEQDVDYIIIDPIVSTGWDTVLGECEEAGIPVIVIDRTIDDSDKYVSWVGSDFLTEGKAAGEWLKAYAAKQGISEINYLIIQGTTGSSAQIGRTDGFREIAKAEGWNELDAQTGDFTEAGGQEVMESFCKSYAGKFNVVICENDNEAFGAMTAMDNAGVKYGPGNDVILISYDACTAGLKEVQAGKITADFECNPLAAPTVEKVIQTLQSGGTPEAQILVPDNWYALKDQIVDFSVDGNAQSMTEVTDAVIEAQY
ncbi:MAG: ABC transporter substrate-binding protein [Lachnospiraceae bacterium]|nr:ABC transporter substrate-binding protein [Lachnospiraceae bacterium]